MQDLNRREKMKVHEVWLGRGRGREWDGLESLMKDITLDRASFIHSTNMY